jgi:thiol-disulfide isomerase/thioredoxin
MLILASLVLLAQNPTPPAPAANPENDAYTAAMALKQKNRWAEAAAAFEKFIATYPDSTQVPIARVQAGISWFGLGKDAQQLHRNTPETAKDFDQALGYFEQVMKDHPESPVASRACYMRGSTHLFSGDLEAAMADYNAVLDHFKADPAYIGNALERRAFVKRQMLDAPGCVADLQRWLKENKTADKLDQVNRDLAAAQMLDKPAPPFVPDAWAAGAPVTLDSLKGEVVAFYFFATWCPHCKEELPFMMDLEHRFTPQGVHFVGVMDYGHNQTPASVAAYLKAQNIPFTVFMDKGQTWGPYDVQSIPTLCLIDRDGRLRWRDNPANLNDYTLTKLLQVDTAPKDKSQGQSSGK